MPTDRIKNLQAQLSLSTSLDDVRANRTLIDAELEYQKSQVKIVEALRRANQELCTHPNKQSYSDPRDSGWDCPDCGASR
jgi:hypothetical protein